MPVFHSGTGAYESTRTGAWPHAAARISHVRIFVAAVAGFERKRAVAIRFRRPLSERAPFGRVEKRSIELGREAGLAAHDDAAPPRLELLPAAAPFEPRSDEELLVGSWSGLRQSGNASACDSPPDAMSATRAVGGRASPSERGPELRRSRCRRGSGGANAFTSTGTIGAGTSESMYCTACVIPWSIVSAAENAMSNSSSTSASRIECANAGSAGQRALRRAVLSRAVDRADADQERGHEVEPKPAKVVRPDDDDGVGLRGDEHLVDLRERGPERNSAVEVRDCVPVRVHQRRVRRADAENDAHPSLPTQVPVARVSVRAIGRRSAYTTAASTASNSSFLIGRCAPGPRTRRRHGGNRRVALPAGGGKRCP